MTTAGDWQARISNAVEQRRQRDRAADERTARELAELQSGYMEALNLYAQTVRPAFTEVATFVRGLGLHVEVTEEPVISLAATRTAFLCTLTVAMSHSGPSFALSFTASKAGGAPTFRAKHSSGTTTVLQTKEPISAWLEDEAARLTEELMGSPSTAARPRQW